MSCYVPSFRPVGRNMAWEEVDDDIPRTAMHSDGSAVVQLKMFLRALCVSAVNPELSAE